MSLPNYQISTIKIWDNSFSLIRTIEIDIIKIIKGVGLIFLIKFLELGKD